MKKPKVGDTLYLVNEGINVRRYAREPKNAVVAKVGRKYIYIEGDGYATRQKFSLAHTGDRYTCDDNLVTSSWTLYESQKAYEDMRDAERLLGTIRRLFGDYGPNPAFTLTNLREIATILGLDETKEGE